MFKELGDPLLIVRGTDGVVRCFYNTCQHRGAPVVREDRGSARRLRCQYHSWTYEIDGGTLVALPDERDFVDLDWEQRCLPKVSCDTYGGFIFVNRDPEAMPLLDWIGPAARMLEPVQPETLREVYRESVIVPVQLEGHRRSVPRRSTTSGTSTSTTASPRWTTGAPPWASIQTDTRA